jgi:ERCC4-type nuclease
MKLLRHFGSIERVAKASAEELSPFVGKKTATEVAEHFGKQRSLPSKVGDLADTI